GNGKGDADSGRRGVGGADGTTGRSGASVWDSTHPFRTVRRRTAVSTARVGGQGRRALRARLPDRRPVRSPRSARAGISFFGDVPTGGSAVRRVAETRRPRQDELSNKR